MRPNLLPTDPLTQVVFVHDYIQLAFQDTGFSIYNRLTIHQGGDAFDRENVGFCDRLVSLIGQTVRDVGVDASNALRLTFENGTELCVVPDGDSVEGWQFNSLNQPAVVFQNS